MKSAVAASFQTRIGIESADMHDTGLCIEGAAAAEPVDGEFMNHAAMGVWYNPLEELPRSSSRVVVDGCQRVPELLGLALESGPESRFT